MDFERTLKTVGDLGGITRRSTRISSPPMMPDKRETWVVQTTRTAEGTFVFLEVITAENQAVRLAVPPKVVASLYAQHESITAAGRRTRARNAAQTRREQGVIPFQKKAG